MHLSYSLDLPPMYESSKAWSTLPVDLRDLPPELRRRLGSKEFEAEQTDSKKSMHKTDVPSV
jgi:hypothetical protein